MSAGDEEIDDLLPGLRYLAAEALRAGHPVVARIIADAIAAIEQLYSQGEDEHEQCGIHPPLAPGNRARH